MIPKIADVRGLYMNQGLFEAGVDSLRVIEMLES